MMVSGLHGFFTILIACAGTCVYNIKIEINTPNPDTKQHLLHINRYPCSSNNPDTEVILSPVVMLEPLSNETDVEFWQRQNKQDNAIGLYCQSCCYRYPNDCDSIETLHSYDRSAETCPDFIPKDFYKPKSKAKCWKKRLEVDPNWTPLPDCQLWHPYYRILLVDSVQYYKIMTKAKALNFLKVEK